MNFKPMLAEDVDLRLVRYPVIASPKLDGVRATFVDGKLLTRSLKLLPNKEIQAIFHGQVAPLDGEIIVGDPTAPDVFRTTMKVVSAFHVSAKDARFYVFDWVNVRDSFIERWKLARKIAEEHHLYVPVPIMECLNERELMAYEDACLETGYEGVMLRDPKGLYKYGRSTAREGALLKMKRKQTGTAVVLSVVEQMHNANEAKINELGYTERSSHQANLVPTGVLGAAIVKDLTSGVEFNVGTGWTADERAHLWKVRNEMPGWIMEYESLGYGVKDRPRHPVFKAWRMKEDT